MENTLLTTSELKEKLSKLSELFEEEKKYIFESTVRMTEYSKEYDDIIKIINTREGKNAKQ